MNPKGKLKNANNHPVLKSLTVFLRRQPVVTRVSLLGCRRARRWDRIWQLSVGRVPIFRGEGDSPESWRGLREFESHFRLAFAELSDPNDGRGLFLGAVGVDDVNLLALFQWNGEADEASLGVDYNRFCGFFVERCVCFRNSYGDWYCDLHALRAATARAVFVGQFGY